MADSAIAPRERSEASAFLRYAGQRLLLTLPLILAIIVIAFLISHVLPGDPVQGLVGDVAAPPEYLEQLRKDFGLDKPLLAQLVLYVSHLLQGDFGYSYVQSRPVLEIIAEYGLDTLLLMIPALIIASVVGVCLALISARKAGKAADGAISTLALFGYSVPVFWLAQVVIVVFSVQLGWLPAQGMRSVIEDKQGFGAFLDVAQHWILPAFCVSVYYMAIVARVGRAAIVEAFEQDYVVTASAVGLSERRIALRHVLPNALVPILTVVGRNFGYALTGALLAEVVFGWPGIGRVFVDALVDRDYPLLNGIFVVSALLVLVANFITDMLYFVVDPRVRAEVGSRA